MLVYIKCQINKFLSTPTKKLNQIVPATEIPKPHVDSILVMRRRASITNHKYIQSLKLITGIFLLKHKTILLTKEEETALHKIMKKFPQIFDKIDDAVTTIARKGRIELHDIPQIVYIIYHNLLPNKYISHENALNIIKFIVDTILDSFGYPLSLLENDIIAKQIVLNNSFALLTAKLPESKPKSKISFCDWFMNHDAAASASISTFG